MTRKEYVFDATDATREQILLHASICGPGGSGKTKTAMTVAARMVERMGLGPMFVIDTESRSALRYAYSPRSGTGFRFKHVPMPEDDYSPEAYVAALEYCERQGAGVIVIDSLSHAWAGINGVLEQVDQKTSKNAFSEGWKAMTPVQLRFIQRILSSSAHVIWTLRSKVEWTLVENDRGKKEPKRMGLAPVQRDGVEYEPDLFLTMTVPEHDLIVEKSRCDLLTMGEVIKRPDVKFADTIIDWLTDAEPPAVARSLGEAIDFAVRECLAAMGPSGKDARDRAKKKFTSWCLQRGVAETRYNQALDIIRDRIGVSALPAGNSVTIAAPSGGAQQDGWALSGDDAPPSPRPDPLETIARDIGQGLTRAQVVAVQGFVAMGEDVARIARYRREQTGGLADEVLVGEIVSRLGKIKSGSAAEAKV